MIGATDLDTYRRGLAAHREIGGEYRRAVGRILSEIETAAAHPDPTPPLAAYDRAQRLNALVDADDSGAGCV